MNKKDLEVLRCYLGEEKLTQREMANLTHCSLGRVNLATKQLQEAGYLTRERALTEKARSYMERFRPRQAIILAAGYGKRMVPINTEAPKALLEVYGETLIERIIRQLKDVGVTKITIVVGYLKEMMEFLIDKHNVDLVVNMNYKTRNTLASLAKVVDRLEGSYVIPANLWCRNNPFDRHELYSWYAVTRKISPDSDYRVTRSEQITLDESGGYHPLGLAYIGPDIAQRLREKIEKHSRNPHRYMDPWEEAAFSKGKMLPFARVLSEEEVVEINTYEDLRDLDHASTHLESDVLAIIEEALGVDAKEVKEIQTLKKGMTNRSFLFRCRNQRYIMRIPGEGSNRLVDRSAEYACYRALAGTGTTDDICYMNPNNGYKLTRYLEDAVSCDPKNMYEVSCCMDVLRRFHQAGYTVEHRFDLFKRIDDYEALRGAVSIYKDYAQTKAAVFSLKEPLKKFDIHEVLTHIDANPDNFLLVKDGDVIKDIRLIDWEYAAMQDPDVDIAMFCIYSLYTQEEIDAVIRAYHGEEVSDDVRQKIYAYIAIGGLLWSNWCEVKRLVGIEFGEYALAQYRYAKIYPKKFWELEKGR